MNIAIKVRDYMNTDVITVRPETELMQVVSTLIENDISGLVVVDENGRLVGMVTERDCIGSVMHSGYFDQLGGPVSGYMSTEIETVAPDDNLVDVAVRLNQSAFRRFPVIDDGRLVGIIARRDVLRALLHRR